MTKSDSTARASAASAVSESIASRTSPFLSTTNSHPSHIAASAFCEPEASPAHAWRQSAADSSAENGRPAYARSQHFEKNRYRLAADQFIAEQCRKNLIVLHFTAGKTCESAFRHWSADAQRVGTAFGVDPDGTVVEFFPPQAWAYHLGIKGTSEQDRRSIGIEIASVGPLKPAPHNQKQLNWWPGDWGANYCTLEQQDAYVRHPYRGISYFAAMPAVQQDAVAHLVRSLCERFEIPLIASAAARGGVFAPQEFAAYKGIASHSNFREDKWDVGPAFNWDRIG